jgi:hypothetical protein
LDSIEILLNDASAGLAAQATVPGGAGFYVLEIDNEVIVNLHEDGGTGRVSLFAELGYLDRADWLAGQSQCWSCEVRDHPGDADACRTLCVDPVTRKVMMVHSIQRARLDNVRFREELERFVSACRFWRPLLPAEPADQSSATACR